jgi:hypothetical protein
LGYGYVAVVVAPLVNRLCCFWFTWRRKENPFISLKPPSIFSLRLKADSLLSARCFTAKKVQSLARQHSCSTRTVDFSTLPTQTLTRNTVSPANLSRRFDFGHHGCARGASQVRRDQLRHYVLGRARVEALPGGVQRLSGTGHNYLLVSGFVC